VDTQGCYVSLIATEFVKHFGQYRERVQREIIAITSHGRTSGYFLSENEYSEYMRLKTYTRHAYHISELPKETIDAIAKSEMSESHNYLNSLME
jgi:PHD/YefM family antitoxin component YafN of YafNO toxin-antitoxin module